MTAWLTDWVQLLARWVHVLAAIAWIGHAFFFHSMENGLRAPEVDDVDPDVHGELWMVHGGGFFRMQKTRVLPQIYTGHLHWFKYEALLTWVSGFLLLISLYYVSAGALMVDVSVWDMSAGASVGIGLATLIGGWAVYDFLWAGPIARHSTTLATVLSAVLVAGIGVGLTFVLSGRAAFLHTGALLGTLMTANVWMRIIPGSKKMVAALERGEEPDLRYGKVGHQRSVHNGYMHFPIVFLMISNHYPFTYGHDLSWLILLIMLALGAAVRQLFYDGWAAHWAVKATVGFGLFTVLAMTYPVPAPVVETLTTASEGRAIDPSETSSITGTVTLLGTPPPPKELKLYGDCLKTTTGPVYSDAVKVVDGKLENAIVWLSDGWEDWSIPAPPPLPVEVDQRGCVYEPRIHAVRVGQPVEFINSDSIFHNVRTVADDNPSFNLTMPAKDQRIQRTFGLPEVAVAARCDVHPWMLSQIAVLPHDWFAISDAAGRFELGDVPPGDYTLSVWHEVYGRKDLPVTAGATGLELTYEVP